MLRHRNCLVRRDQRLVCFLDAKWSLRVYPGGLVDFAKAWVHNTSRIEAISALPCRVDRSLSSHDLIAPVRIGHMLSCRLLLQLILLPRNVRFLQPVGGETCLSRPRLAGLSFLNLLTWYLWILKRRYHLLSIPILAGGPIVIRHSIGPAWHTLAVKNFIFWLLHKCVDLMLNPLPSPLFCIHNPRYLQCLSRVKLLLFFIELLGADR